MRIKNWGNIIKVSSVKTIFVVCLMINIVVMLVFGSVEVSDSGSVFNESRSNLAKYYTTGTNYGNASSGTLHSNITSSESMLNPITEDATTSLTIIRSDNPLRMIASGLKMLFAGMFGVLYVLTSTHAPLFVIWLIGIPFTLLYLISFILIIRGVD